jgi:hypothetical protein
MIASSRRIISKPAWPRIGAGSREGVAVGSTVAGIQEADVSDAAVAKSAEMLDCQPQ